MFKNIKFIFLLILLLLTSLYPVFSLETSEVEVRYATTKHFKIIFPMSCSFTAKHLYDNAERIYNSLVERFNEDPELFIPVYVTDKNKETNAFFSPFPSNYITIYDFGNVSSSLYYLEDTYLQIFEHELTHAFNINLRSPFWKFLSKIFSDALNSAQIFYENNFFIEGLAVFMESQNGYGRLNDPYVMNILKQAKLDGTFPSWTDVSSARDTYPYGEYNYYYSGFFLQYLANTYGTDTLLKFYEEAEHFHITLPTNELFTKVFGERPEKIWNNFKESIPSVSTDLEAKKVNNKLGIYNQTLYKNGYFYTYNTITGNLERYLSSDTDKKAESVLLTPSLDSFFDISNSLDILITHRQSNMCSLDLYNAEKKKVSTLTSSTDYFIKSCFTYIDNIQHVLTVSIKENYTFLTLLDIELNEIKKECLGYDHKVISLCPLKDSKVALLISKSGKEYICILDTETFEFTYLHCPESIQLRGLSYEIELERLYFSYNEKEISSHSIARIGYVEITNSTEGEWFLSKENVSGGINYPSISNTTVFFISDFHSGNTISELDISKLTFISSYKTQMNSGSYYDYKTDVLNLSAFIFSCPRYNAASNLLRGTIIPLGPNLTITELGLSYITWDPSDKFGIEGGAGYNFKNKSVNIKLALNEKSGAFSFSEGLRTHIPVQDTSNTFFDFFITASALFRLNHDNEYINVYDNLDIIFPLNNKSFISNLFILEYSNLNKTGFGKFDYSGFVGSLTLDNKLPTLNLSYMFSKFIPVGVSLSLSLLENNVFALTESSNITVYNWEIQRGIPYLYIYLKRLYIQAGISNTTYFGNFKPLNTTNIKCGLHLDTGVNVGYLSNLTFTLNTELDWNINTNKASVSFYVNIKQ